MASAPLQPGTVLNQRFDILEIVGQGGMGTVYKAEHNRLHMIYAVKEIRGTNLEGAEKQQDLAACEHEAQFLVKLDHPHLPKVTDAFIENDNFYLVMQFIEGVTLDTRLMAAGGAPLDVLQSVEWGLQIADVLAYLHSQEPQIIFRDLKPSNVMIQPDGSIKLIDFGIARHFQPGASKDTSLLGSVGYSPPEQFGKGQTDARSDVYAFGATLHHLVTGRDPALQPFKFAPAHTLNLQVPQSLSHLLDTCLAIEPSHRPQSINVAAMQLVRIREELVQRRAQAAEEQAAMNAVGRSLAESMEHAGTGIAPRINASPSTKAGPSTGERNGEQSKEKQEPPKPAIKVTTASTAKAARSSSSDSPSGFVADAFVGDCDPRWSGGYVHFRTSGKRAQDGRRAAYHGSGCARGWGQNAFCHGFNSHPGHATADASDYDRAERGRKSVPEYAPVAAAERQRQPASGPSACHQRYAAHCHTGHGKGADGRVRAAWRIFLRRQRAASINPGNQPHVYQRAALSMRVQNHCHCFQRVSHPGNVFPAHAPADRHNAAKPLHVSGHSVSERQAYWRNGQSRASPFSIQQWFFRNFGFFRKQTFPERNRFARKQSLK